MSKREDQVVIALRNMGRVGLLPASVIDVAVRYVDDELLQNVVLNPLGDVAPILHRVIHLVDQDRHNVVLERASWKEAWFRQRDATGVSYWNGFDDARGVSHKR